MFDYARRTKITRLVGAAVLAMLGAAACFSERTTDPNGNGNGGPAAAVVEMTDALTFDSDSVRVSVGETVRWTNPGTVAHTVTADPAEADDSSNVSLPEGAETFDSGFLAAGDTFEYTFTVPGRYDYICRPHESAEMFGTVIVEE